MGGYLLYRGSLMASEKLLDREGSGHMKRIIYKGMTIAKGRP